MISLSISKERLRKILFIGSILLTVFVFIDLSIIPEVLHDDYKISRLGFQIPIILLLIAYSWHASFDKNRQMAILLTITVVTFANYWMIQQSWLKAEYPFSYEGTLLYTFFAFFVMRINFKYGLMYVVLSLLGFGALIIKYPVYGSFNTINFGFVAMAQTICLFGLYTLNDSLNKVDSLTVKLQELSRVDQLTGLFNRRAYEQDGKLLFEHTKRLKVSFCVIMIDIDNFKDYNDAYGHQKGDDAIRIQANILKSIFQRQSDILGRFGGEEFIIIVSNISESGAQKMAQRILNAWHKEQIPHGAGDGAEFLSCSIGIANKVPTGQETLESFIGEADEALFKAKDGGRNQFKVSSAD